MHTYEEIRSVALDILSGRETVSVSINQFGELGVAIAEVLHKREDRDLNPNGYGGRPNLLRADEEIFREVFWEIFRQGIITLGMNSANPNFPFFKISNYGQELVQNESSYFFHDVSSYEASVRAEVPDINETTLIYLKEAMQAFRAGCLLSSTVMLGVAAEHSFYLLIETINQNPEKRGEFENVYKEQLILGKITKFKNIIDGKKRELPPEVKEDLDTHFAGIQAVIRSFRNDAGHPTGRIMQREQVYVLLNLFISYCKKLYQLKNYYS